MSDREPLITEGSPLAANPDDAQGPRRSAPRQRPGGDRRPVGNSVVMAILAVGLVIAGFFIATQHQALATAKDSLAKSEQRIAALEERLQVTDQTMSESGKEVNSQLGVWQDEIRKLWEVTNKQHKAWILENKAKIKEQDEQLKGIGASVADLKASVARHETSLAQQAALAEQLATVEQQLKVMTNQQRQLTDQVNATRQSVAGLETGLARRVGETEKAVQAIDAYRLQLNSRLVDLQTRVDNLSAPH